MLCPYCSEDIADGAIKCKHCGEVLDKVRHAQVKDEKLEQGLEEISTTLQPYYQEAFQKIKTNNGKPIAMFNAAGFLFGLFWYFYKGMWVRGGLGILIGVLTGGLGVIAFWLYVTFFGTYDYYQFKVKDRQLWFV